ncbi:tomoregulin-2-like, partial [Saccoglossus kowalevskii]
MKVASCQEKRDIYIMSEGECESDEISGSGSGDMPDEEDSMEVGSGAMECDETTCRYGGACIYDVDDSVTCSCDMVCPALRSPVCGSDGITYSNDCELKLAMCQQQKWIGIETCEDVEMEPCDGELPLTDADTGKEYFCGEGPNHSECPAGSYCHIHPTGSFAKCCK